jgi:menaquinone-dependent protoporphyrinogen oxidase
MIKERRQSMKRILILYGTTDGHTRKIAEDIGRTIGDGGCRAVVVDAARVPANLRPADYDGVIVAASIQMGGYQRFVRRWVQRHATQLNALPGAFVSVCLGILESRPAARNEVFAILERFLDRTGWRPAMTRTVAGALPYTRYNWLKKWMLRRIVAKAGGATDTTRDYEYTNWDELRAFARDFAARFAVAPPAVVS